MRCATLIAAGFAALLTIASAAPAWAEYGALARDDTTGKFGLSWNEQSAKRAEDIAIKDCGGAGGCKIIFRTGPKQCGAIATAEKGNAWGASDKGNRKDTVELRALKGCQERASGLCKVRASGCNR